MKIFTISAIALLLGGCQSMIVTEMPDGTKVKTPTSLVAVQEAQKTVNDCRIAVLQSQTNTLTKLDTSSEAGRAQLMMMAMIQENQLAQCDRVVTEVASQFNATDRSRLQVIRAGVGVAGGVAGGYMLGQALEGVASAAGTRINATNSNVTALKGKVRVGDSDSPAVSIGGGTVSITDSNTITGDKSTALTRPTSSEFVGGNQKLQLDQRLDIPGSDSSGTLSQ